MNKFISIVVMAILLSAVAYLTYTNHQILAHNTELSNQVSLQNAQLNRLSASSKKIEQRLLALESNQKHRMRELLTFNHR